MTDRSKSRPLAFEDPTFLQSDSARPVRIMAEYLGPMAEFQRQRITDTVLFFGSARLQPSSPYYEAARQVAHELTRWSSGLPGKGRRFLVCTGGGPGIMEAANRGAHDAGGKSIGLNIGLPHEQLPNPYITAELSFEFHYFFMRKLWFAHLAAAAVIFPGGFGTLDELCELLTLAQTGKLERGIPILLYGSDYWDRVLNLQALAEMGTISEADLDLFETVDDPGTAFEKLRGALADLPASRGAMPAFAHSVAPTPRGGE